VSDEPNQADHTVTLELLRTQVVSCQTRLSARVRACQRAEAALQQYLEALFPHLFPQALAAQMNVVEAAEYFLAHHLHGDDPLQLFGTTKPDTLPVSSQPTPEVTDDPGIALSGDAVHFLYAAGQTVLAKKIKALWGQRTGKTEGTVKNFIIPELLDKGVLRVEQIPVPRYLTGYAGDTCYLLTAAGQTEYRRRFSSDPITYEAAYAPYKSPEAWWMIRAAQALITAGNDHPANARFTYTVYDPSGAPGAASAAGFERRYGHSEPDLVAAVTSQSGGKPSTIAIECERGTYNSTRLKQKVLKNLQDYGTAGFSGCYYIANNAGTARNLAGAISKVRADLKARPDALTVRSFLALFTLETLRETWLPTPRFIDAHFFDRKQRRVNEDWPVDAAKPERYFRHSPMGKDEGGSKKDEGKKRQDAGSKITTGCGEKR
jgi:hypothetical protein